MPFVLNLLWNALGEVWLTFSHNWPLLLLSALVATAMKLYVDQHRVAAFLRRNQRAGVVGATALAVATPLCSCGTTAVVLGMMASLMPWAPIVAFMVSSPLTSPEELFYSAGLFGWPFALAFFLASILLGLAGGLLAALAEQQGWLKGQARFQPMAGGSGDSLPAAPARVRPDAQAFDREFAAVGGRLLLLFFGFASLGYIINGLIPQEWVASLFGGGRIYGVPLAATLGLPLYLNTEASLPLVRSFLEMGMSPGATLAFLITGAGTSIGAISGALTIARWRVVAIVVGTLWVGAIAIGYAYNGLLATGIF